MPTILSIYCSLTKNSNSFPPSGFYFFKLLLSKIHHLYLLPAFYSTYPHLSLCPNTLQTLYNSCINTLEDFLLHFSYIQEDSPATSACTFYMNGRQLLLVKQPPGGICSDLRSPRQLSCPYALLIFRKN